MDRIGIDIRKIRDFGIGTYISNLVSGLDCAQSGNEYVLFHKPGEETSSLPAGMAKAVEKSGLYSVREPFSLGKNARRHKLKLLHCPHYVTPFRPGCRMAVTIHDLIHLLFPQYLPSMGARAYANYFLNRAVKHADIIFTVSEATKKDILEHLPAQESRIKVVYNAIDPVFCQRWEQAALDQLLASNQIERPYVLYVGNNKAHKNLEVAVSAFGLFRKQVGKEWSFVMAGSPFQNAEGAAALLSQIEESGLSDAFIFPGPLSKRDLAGVYAAAGIFLFPSLYEGFGLPPMEAMAAGAPVVASNVSALPEVLGDSAILVDPHYPEQFSSAMESLAGDSQLRKNLVAKGRERAKLFSPEKMVAQTLQGYRFALES